MKWFTIKYETYDSNVKVVTVNGFSIQHAASQLNNCKEIYWINVDGLTLTH